MDKNLKRCVCVCIISLLCAWNIISQLYFSKKKKYTTLWQNLDFGGGFLCGDRRCKNTVLFPQFCCEPKTALKINVINLKTVIVSWFQFGFLYITLNRQFFDWFLYPSGTNSTIYIYSASFWTTYVKLNKTGPS